MQCSVVFITNGPPAPFAGCAGNSSGVTASFGVADDSLASQGASTSVAPFTASSSTSSSKSTAFSASTTTTNAQSTESSGQPTSPTGPSSPPASSGETQDTSSGLPLGAKVGLGVGLGVGGFAIIATILACLFLRRRRRGLQNTDYAYSSKPELDGVPSQRQELDGGGLVELEGTAFPRELHHQGRGHGELEGSMPVMGHYDPVLVVPATERHDTYHAVEHAPTTEYLHTSQAQPHRSEAPDYAFGAPVIHSSAPQPDWSTSSATQVPPAASDASSQASSSRGREAQIAELLVRQEQ